MASARQNSWTSPYHCISASSNPDPGAAPVAYLAQAMQLGTAGDIEESHGPRRSQQLCEESSELQVLVTPVEPGDSTSGGGSPRNPTVPKGSSFCGTPWLVHQCVI